MCESKCEPHCCGPSPGRRSWRKRTQTISSNHVERSLLRVGGRLSQSKLSHVLLREAAQLQCEITKLLVLSVSICVEACKGACFEYLVPLTLTMLV